MKRLIFLLFTVAVVGVLMLRTTGSDPAHAIVNSRTYTLDADFDEGVLVSVNHDAPNTQQLQLNATQSTFPFINIAASARGTTVRIDVNTGSTLGEYSTAPAGRGKNPSRTTVDQQGNVWVANRNEFGSSGGQSKGSIARIGLVIGGTRANSDGTPNPAGQYLAPPYEYITCVDRHGATIADASDGLIKTSSGLGNILPWSNAGGADTQGGVSTADDECIINYTRVTGTGTRTVAIDANNDVWVGGLSDRDHEKVDGVTGLPVPNTQFNLGCGGYGGLIDGNGTLWSARNLLRFVPNPSPPPAGAGACLGDSTGNYGLGIDPNTGHIWHSTLGGSPRLYELDSAGNVVNSYPQPFGAQGVAVDGNSHVWVAQIFGSLVAHYAPDPLNPGTHIFVGNVSGFAGTTGVAVDANGKIWASEINSSATRGAARIDPNAGPIGNGGFNVGAIDLTVGLGSGGSPYNYSDMTGFVALGTTAPQGFWTVIFDSEEAGTEWGAVSWNTENAQNCPGTAAEREPAGTSITARARSAETEAGLGAATFVVAANGSDINPPNGRFLQVAVKLTPNANGKSPILCDVTIQTGTGSGGQRGERFPPHATATPCGAQGCVPTPTPTTIPRRPRR